VLASLDINPSDVAFGPDGILYAVIGPTVTGNTDRLIRINPLTGQAVLVGNIGFRSVDGIAFGPDGRLYGAANAARLIAINPATGAGSAIGVFSNFREMVGLGSAPPSPITTSAPSNLRATVNGSTVALAWDGAPGATYLLEAGSAPGLANLFNGNVGGVTSLTTSAPPGTVLPARPICGRRHRERRVERDRGYDAGNDWRRCMCGAQRSDGERGCGHHHDSVEWAAWRDQLPVGSGHRIRSRERVQRERRADDGHSIQPRRRSEWCRFPACESRG
jgi:hypothetical protein